MEPVVTEEVRKQIFNLIENWKFEDAQKIVEKIDSTRRNELLMLRQNGIFLKDRFRFTCEAMGGENKNELWDKFQSLYKSITNESFRVY